jgi:hypothetical protein
MKTPSTELFKLIKSLTKTEKRYFTRRSENYRNDKSNQYYQLFKLIDNQLIYDEDLAKKTLIDLGIAEHFTALKFQLTERILESLHLFHQKQSIAEIIKKELGFVRILITKSQFSIANKRIEKAGKLISEYDLIEFLPESFRLKRHLINRQFYKNITEKDLAELHQQEKIAIEQLQNIFLFENLNATIQKNHYQKVHSINFKIEDFNQNEILINKDLPNNFSSKILQLQALATFNFMQGKTAIAYEHNLEFINTLEDSGNRIYLFSNQYISVLSNILIDNLILKKYDVLEKGIEKLRNIAAQKQFQKRIPNLNSRVFRQTYLLEMNFLIATKQFERAILLIPEIENGIKKHQKNIGLHNEITFNYLMAYAAFGNQNFTTALTYINEILNRKAKVVTEIFEFAHLLNLITHFELQNYDLLDSLIPSTRRLLRKRRALYQMEIVLFTYFKKYINVVDKKAQTKLREDLSVDIARLKQEKSEQRVFNYFDFDLL